MLTVAALLAYLAAILMFMRGVVATSAVYGTRVAWLIGVVLPVLAFSTLLSWLAYRTGKRTATRSTMWVKRLSRGLMITDLCLLGIPLALTITYLTAYALMFIWYVVLRVKGL